MRRSSDFMVMLRMLSELGKLKYVMVVTILCGVGGYFAAASIPVFTAVGALGILGAGNIVPFGAAVLIVVLSAVSRGMLRYCEQLTGHYIAFKILAALRDKVFGKLRQLAPAKLNGNGKGDTISIITADIELLETFYAHTVAPVMIAFLASAAYVAVLANIHWAFGTIGAVAYISAGIIMPLMIKRISADSGAKYRAEMGKSSAFFLDSLRGVSEIFMFGAGEKRGDEIDSSADNMAHCTEKLRRNEGTAQAAGGLIATVFFLMVLLMGAVLFENGKVDISGLIIAAVLLISSFGPSLALSALSATLASTMASARRVFSILDESPVVDEVFGKLVPEGGSAEYKNAGFSYPGSIKKIMEDFNGGIREKDITGFQGPSGSGKSTALKLMMRFYDTDHGCVEVAKCDVRKMPTRVLRGKQVFMAQETMLFNDTLENNIRMGNIDAPMEQVAAAAKKAAIHDFIESLPEGYQTCAGELGGRVSTGEKQRIALARVFFRDSEMLLLDEPTSSLDVLNEAQILKSLRDHCGDKTVVLVSHRKSTSSICEKIIEFDKET